jgi:PhnB protein
MTEHRFITIVTTTLFVKRWAAEALGFYKTAFGATELHRVPGGGVAQLAIDGAQFWVAEESTEHSNFSPETLGGCSARMLLVVEEPEAICRKATAAGAKLVYPVNEAHGWKIGRLIDPAGHHWEIARKMSC